MQLGCPPSSPTTPESQPLPWPQSEDADGMGADARAEKKSRGGVSSGAALGAAGRGEQRVRAGGSLLPPSSWPHTRGARRAAPFGPSPLEHPDLGRTLRRTPRLFLAP